VRLPEGQSLRTIRLYTPGGVLLTEWRVCAQGEPLYVGALRTGMYLVQVQTEAGRVHKKLLVQ
jgi:hypothetical protein